jgi:parallel beta-helix repeat protein
MKKVLSVLLIVCLLVQAPLSVLAAPIRGPVSPIRVPTEDPTGGTAGDTTSDTTPEAAEDPTEGLIRDPIRIPTEIQFPEPIKSDMGIFIEPSVIDQKLFALSLAASKFPGKPDAAEGYSVTNTVFIDWNRSDKSWWFKWNQKLNTASQMVWQVSNMPYTGGTEDMEEPLGLVANGVIGSGQKEFNIDFFKFVLSPNAVKKNFITPAFTNMLSVAVSGQNNSNQITAGKKGFLALQNSLAKKAGQSQAQQTSRLNVIEEASKKNNPDSRKGAGAAIITEETMTARKDILAVMGISATQYKYYVRVIALDKAGKPLGNPSNPIEVIYGDPSYYDELATEKKSVQISRGDLGYDDKCFLDWNDPPSGLLKRFIAPLADKENYAYSFFQVTAVYPVAGKRMAFSPSGLVRTEFTGTILTGSQFPSYAEAWIDFSKFTPPADKSNPVQYRYYVRAVHVYADYDSPGMAHLKFSPPLTVTYGAYDAKASQDPFTVNVDIGTPSIRFVKYEPPYFGDRPWDIVEVVEKPGSPFGFMKVGSKYSLTDIQNWLEDKSKDDNPLITILKCFGGLFTELKKLVNSVSALWAKIQQSFVGMLGAIGIPESIGGFMVTAALVACGIPPSIPNISDLKSMGASSISTMIVEQSGGIIPKEIAEKVVKEVMNQAEAEANKVVEDLPKDLSALEGRIKPDRSRIWRPATITIDMYNPYSTKIPSGEFDLTIGEAGGSGITPAEHPYFRPQRLPYPAIPAGETVSMAFPLEENCGWTIENGEKRFLQYNQYYSEWEYMLNYQNSQLKHKQLGAYITDITPHIPEYAEFEKELGLAPGTIMVNFNYQNYALSAAQDMNDISSFWAAVGMTGGHFPGVIYVSPSGNDDDFVGSKGKPLKSITAALIKAQEGDSVVLLPGTYETDGVELYRPYVRLYGSGAGTVLKGSAKCATVLTITAAATGALASGFTIEGGTQQGALVDAKSKAGLENLKVQNTGGTGIKVNGGIKVISTPPAGVSVVNCQVTNTGLKAKSQGHGILVQDAVAARIEGCTITNTAADGIHFAKNSGDSTVNNCAISQCGNNGIFLEGEYIKVSNSFIRDTDSAGVMFSGTKNCNVRRCTILDTAKKNFAPVTLGISQSGSNTIDFEQFQGFGSFPATNYADENLIVQQNTQNRYMVVVQSDGSKTALAYHERPLIMNNIYYAKAGAVQFYDSRPYDLTHPGADNPQDAATYAGGLTSEWKNWVGELSYNPDYSQELKVDPKIDAKGRSALPECFGTGVQ